MTTAARDRAWVTPTRIGQCRRHDIADQPHSSALARLCVTIFSSAAKTCCVDGPHAPFFAKPSGRNSSTGRFARAACARLRAIAGLYSVRLCCSCFAACSAPSPLVIDQVMTMSVIV